MYKLWHISAKQPTESTIKAATAATFVELMTAKSNNNSKNIVKFKHGSYCYAGEPLTLDKKTILWDEEWKKGFCALKGLNSKFKRFSVKLLLGFVVCLFKFALKTGCNNNFF